MSPKTLVVAPSRLAAAQQAAAGNLGRFPRASEVGSDDPRMAHYSRPRVQVAAATPPPSAAALAKGKGKRDDKSQRDDKGKKGDANRTVIAALDAAGKLLASGRVTHSYPHSWRSKAPLIFRNTPQWFIAMDKDIAGKNDSLRNRALKAIDDASKASFTPLLVVHPIAWNFERDQWLPIRQAAEARRLAAVADELERQRVAALPKPEPKPAPEPEPAPAKKTRGKKAAPPPDDDEDFED